jgi:hypothetical protein
MEKQNIKIIEVFSGSSWEAGMVKNLLENAGINAFLKDEIIGTRSAVWVPTGGVRVVISNFDYDRAKLVVEEYEKNLKSKN